MEPPACSTEAATDMICSGVRYETVRSSTRQRPEASGSSTAPHLSTPAAERVWARSPTTVIDRIGLRRASTRHAIGDSSCASSTTTCWNAQVRSAEARSAWVSTSPLVAHPREQVVGGEHVAGAGHLQHAARVLGDLALLLRGPRGLGLRGRVVLAQQLGRLVEQGHVLDRDLGVALAQQGVDLVRAQPRGGVLEPVAVGQQPRHARSCGVSGIHARFTARRTSTDARRSATRSNRSSGSMVCPARVGRSRRRAGRRAGPARP